jgi:hypothetical protein
MYGLKNLRQNSMLETREGRYGLVGTGFSPYIIRQNGSALRP